jgi:hypothetical protein
MKKFFVLFVIAALLVAGGSVAYAKPGIGQNGGDISTKAYDWSPERTFRWVRFIPTVGAGKAADLPSLTADSIVIWDTVSDDGCTVTTTTTSNDPRVAGVVLYAIETPDVVGQLVSADNGKRNWGWLQTYGKCEVNMMTLGDSVAGGALGTGSTAGQCASYIASTTTGLTNGLAGFYYDAGTAGATGVEAFLKVQ